MANKSKEKFIEGLKKDPEGLYEIGCILNIAGKLYRGCLNWNDCSRNASGEDCYNIVWKGWEVLHSIHHTGRELLDYYPELTPLGSFCASEPEENTKDASETKGKQWLNDWGLALELGGFFDQGREFCCSLAQLMHEPESENSEDKWKEWQQLDYVERFYDATFDLSKKLYQAPLGILAWWDPQVNPELRLLVLYCLLAEFRQLFIKFMTVSGPYYFNHGTFGCLGEIPEEKALGTLTMAPLGKIIHCEFKTPDNWKLDWDIITRGWAKYEERLLDTWSYENGEYFGSNRVEDRAIWFMEPIMVELFNKMTLDIEKFAVPLLVLDRCQEVTQSVLKIIRRGLAKWYPGKVEWTYLRNLDCVIKSLRTKGRLLESEALAEADQGTKPVKEPQEDELITLTEAAKLLGVDRGTVSRWADEGKIQDNKQKGRRRRVSRMSVLLLKDKREREDLLRDVAEVLQDRASKIPDRH